MNDVFYGWIDTVEPIITERLGSAVFYGDGKGNFTINDLPADLQLAPVFSFQKINNTLVSSNMYVCGGNFFDVIPYEGRYDAQPLALFSIDKQQKINYASQANLAQLKGQIRDVKWLHSAKYGDVLIVARNNSSLMFYGFKNAGD